MDIFVINGKKCTNRQETYDYLRKVFSFPQFFGNNLDALNDSINEFLYKKTIIIINKEYFISNMGQYGKEILKVFEDNNNSGIIQLIHYAL